MGTLRACLYKDGKLFFRGAGVLTLALPLLLLAALRLFPLEAEVGPGSVRPFPIAVRDEDDTVMSRSLISQMARVELFSAVERAQAGETDQQLLDRGAAAVVTIPEDFFYDIYSMSQSPVEVTLNGDMPLEASLFQAVFGSVMDIIRAGQASWRGLYEFCYGELTPELERQLYDESSNDLLRDALGRQTVFDAAVEGADLRGALERRLLAAVYSVTALFFSLCAVRTLPEERALGVLPRYRAAGGSLTAFLLSKLLIALLAVLPALLLGLSLLGGARAGLLAVGLLLLLGAFGPLLAVAAWSPDAAAAQRWGNLVLLLSLVLGGVVWPASLLPAPLSALGVLTLPHWALLGIEAVGGGMSAGRTAALLWPVLLTGATGFALALWGLKRPRGHPTETHCGRAGLKLFFASFFSREKGRPVRQGRGGPPGQPRPLPLRVAGMAEVKLRAMAGGRSGLVLLVLAALLCGGAAAGVRDSAADCLRLAVCDLDNSARSQELIGLLTGRSGVELTLCDEKQGELLLLRGEAEGLFTIGPGYGEALGSDAQTPLRYRGAASSASAQGAREIIAGQVAAQRSRLRAVRLAGERLGPLDETQEAALLACIDRASRDASELYHIRTAGGARMADPFLPGPMAFAALAVLFTLLTAAPWSGAEGRRAARRLDCLPRGKWLAYGSECLALTILGFLTALAVLLPAGLNCLPALPGAAAYAFCAAGLSMALTRLTAAEGRVDGLAPLLALGLCLLGGCFMDLSALSPALRTLSLLTPPGLAVRAGLAVHAGAESLPALIGLLAEGLVFLLLAVPRRE